MPAPEKGWGQLRSRPVTDGWLLKAALQCKVDLVAEAEERERRGDPFDPVEFNRRCIEDFVTVLGTEFGRALPRPGA